MYAVINHLHFVKLGDEFGAGMQQEGVPILASQDSRIFYFVKMAEDRRTVIILWKDAASTQNGVKVFGPTGFAKNIAPYLASEQERGTDEVLVQYMP